MSNGCTCGWAAGHDRRCPAHDAYVAKLMAEEAAEAATVCEWCAGKYPTADRMTGRWHLLPGGVDVPCYAVSRV